MPPLPYEPYLEPTCSIGSWNTALLVCTLLRISVPVDVSIVLICLSKGLKLTSNCNGLSIVIPFSFGRRKAEVHVVVSMFPRSSQIS